MQKRSIINSFKFAIEGLDWAVKNQRNLRIHILVGAGVILFGFLLKISFIKMAILFLAIIFVIVCEIINTALELSLDFINGKKYHPSVKVVKDIVAGAVLFAALNAVIIGLIIFYPYLFD
ncbi:MAG: diacylglycerol kinase [Candidatus Omnitrophota bacterium]|nr:MAG: diacylglycerol kinase [Candidatus Omnitrophota bacterium]